MVGCSPATTPAPQTTTLATATPATTTATPATTTKSSATTAPSATTKTTIKATTTPNPNDMCSICGKAPKFDKTIIGGEFIEEVREIRVTKTVEAR